MHRFAFALHLFGIIVVAALLTLGIRFTLQLPQTSTDASPQMTVPYSDRSATASPVRIQAVPAPEVLVLFRINSLVTKTSAGVNYPLQYTIRIDNGSGSVTAQWGNGAPSRHEVPTGKVEALVKNLEKNGLWRLSNAKEEPRMFNPGPPVTPGRLPTTEYSIQANVRGRQLQASFLGLPSPIHQTFVKEALKALSEYEVPPAGSDTGEY